MNQRMRFAECLFRVAPAILFLFNGCCTPKTSSQSLPPAEQSIVERNKQPPPPPLIGDLVFLGGQQLVEEFFSPDKSQRLVILQKKDGNFSVRSFQWWTGDWATKGNAFWIQGDLLSPAETLEDARRIAKEYMATKWGEN